jgi:hypothetical protein
MKRIGVSLSVALCFVMAIVARLGAQGASPNIGADAVAYRRAERECSEARLGSPRVNALGKVPKKEEEKASSRTRILVLDMSPVREKSEVVNRIFSFSGSDADSTVEKVRTKLREMRKCLPNPADDVAPLADTVLTLLHLHTSRLTKHSSNRWIGTKGDSIQVYILRLSGRPARIDIEELARATRLSSDLVTFAQLALKIATAGTAFMESKPPQYSYTFREYYLTKPRANLKVAGIFIPVAADTPAVNERVGATATSRAARGPPTGRRAVAPGPKLASEADTPKTETPVDTLQVPTQLTTSLITGPREHFFLSANVAAFTTARQVKYDETNSSLDLAATPKEFLVGMNYTFGDLFEDQKHGWLRRFAEGIYLGLMIEGSSKPFDQIGAIVGFRHAPPAIEKILSFEAVSPYVGVVWARNYKTDSPATRVDTDYAKEHFIAGVAVNLEKALKWVGGT